MISTQANLKSREPATCGIRNNYICCDSVKNAPLREGGSEYGNEYTCLELITLTNEELYNGMVNGLLPDLALEVLCDHLKSLILMMSWRYRKTIGMDEDEILQEAKLLLLNLVRKRAFTYTGKAKFSTFFVSAFRFRLYHIYRDFMLHNPMRIGDKKQMVGKGYSYEQLLAYNQRYIERYTEKQRIRAMRRVKRIRGISLPERIEYEKDDHDDGSLVDKKIQSLSDINGRMIISVSLAEHSETSIRIMLGSIYCRQDLLNKACGGNFFVSLELMYLLMYTTAKWNLDETLQIIRHSSNKLIRGISFGENDIYFDGFPSFVDIEHYQAWRFFAIALSEASKQKKAIILKKQSIENEKYSWHTWIKSLHMVGPAFSGTRRILREHLTGNSGFRVPEVKRRALEKFESKPGFAEWKRAQARKYRELHKEEINARSRKRAQEKRYQPDTINFSASPIGQV